MSTGTLQANYYHANANSILTPAFSSSLTGNANGNCPVTLSFSSGTGSGSVNSRSGPPLLDVVGFQFLAKAGSTTSVNSTKVIVPPQVMIQTIQAKPVRKLARGTTRCQLFSNRQKSFRR